MGVGTGLYIYVVVVQKFTFAISSPDEFLLACVDADDNQELPETLSCAESSEPEYYDSDNDPEFIVPFASSSSECDDLSDGEDMKRGAVKKSGISSI